jgi:hypothetical protein
MILPQTAVHFGERMKISALIFFAAAVALTSGAHAQTSATTTTTSARTFSDNEPIALPKLDAGRVTARVNERPATSSVIVGDDRMSTTRLGGITTIRVNPELGIPYTLSNGQAGNTLRSRELDQFRVPMWQIGKF